MDTQDSNDEIMLPDLVTNHYFRLISGIRAVGRAHGYAITVHGSLSRDIDLVAIPWVEKTTKPVELANAIREYTKGVFSQSLQPGYSEAGCPGGKPHGRLGWCINLAEGVYIDLAVMPPVENKVV